VAGKIQRHFGAEWRWIFCAWPSCCLKKRMISDVRKAWSTWTSQSSSSGTRRQPARERALAFKDKVEAAAARPPGRPPASDTLTARERGIASLLADGLSKRLVISEGTVDVHVKHILGKLGFRSRAQVAGWVALQASA
jgi:DNA-binding NarL/FixJ family response regulator